jgi:hypothetical protein
VAKAQLLAPLQGARQSVLKSRYSEVRALARKAERIVDEVVDEYAGQLDEFISAVEEMLDDIRDGRVKDLDEPTLHRMTLRLPTILYRLTSMVDRSAIESDIAKAAVKSVYAQEYLGTTGTIPERNALAELRTAEETLIVDLSKHVHARLKSKFDVADKMFDGIRKVLTSRDNDKLVFRKDRA